MILTSVVHKQVLSLILDCMVDFCLMVIFDIWHGGTTLISKILIFVNLVSDINLKSRWDSNLRLGLNWILV